MAILYQVNKSEKAWSVSRKLCDVTCFWLFLYEVRWWAVRPFFVVMTTISFQLSSAQSLSCVWLCDPMSHRCIHELAYCSSWGCKETDTTERLNWTELNHSTPGLPVHHQLPEPTQTHVHRVGDAIQPSHPLLSPSPPTLNHSQHNGILLSYWK